MILLMRNWTETDDVHYTILCSLCLLELILLVFNIVLFAAAVYLAIQAPFHWNLRILVTVVLSQYYISLLSRIILLLYQLGLFPSRGGLYNCSSYNVTQLIGWSCIPQWTYGISYTLFIINQ